jgi:hypothetical protein
MAKPWRHKTIDTNPEYEFTEDIKERLKTPRDHTVKTTITQPGANHV